MTTVPESKRLREFSSPSQQIVPRRRPRTLGNAKNGVGPATAHGRSYKTVMVVDGFVQMKTAGPFANESISASTASRSNSQATNGALAAGASVNYTQLAGAAIYPEGNCDPTGRALGPGNDIAVGCREGTTGAPLLVQIMGRTTGVILSSPNGGGGNQIKYDPPSNRYFSASSRWTASGTASTNGACSAASPCTPVLTMIDAATRTVVSRTPTGNNAHSVAVDPATGLMFVPYSSATLPAGCANCAANGFVNGGISVFASRQ